MSTNKFYDRCEGPYREEIRIGGIEMHYQDDVFDIMFNTYYDSKENTRLWENFKKLLFLKNVKIKEVRTRDKEQKHFRLKMDQYQAWRLVCLAYKNEHIERKCFRGNVEI